MAIPSLHSSNMKLGVCIEVTQKLAPIWSDDLANLLPECTCMCSIPDIISFCLQFPTESTTHYMPSLPAFFARLPAYETPGLLALNIP